MLLAAVLLDAFHARLEHIEEAFDGVRGDEAFRDHGLKTMLVATDRGCGAAVRRSAGRPSTLTPRFCRGSATTERWFIEAASAGTGMPSTPAGRE
jgi:hypothetical protein